MRTVVVLTTAKPELLAEMQSDDCYSAGVICRTRPGKPNSRVPTRVDPYFDARTCVICLVRCPGVVEYMLCQHC